MRYAVVADLHGRRKAWRRVLADVERHRPDQVICLGDYLEAKVSWRRHDRSRRWDLEDVVDPDPKLWHELAVVDLVLGNQEWRIRDLLKNDQIVGDLTVLLAAPETRMIGAATAMHGHQIGWDEWPDRRAPSMVVYPRLEELPDVPMLMVGHSHQVLLLDIAAHDWFNRDRADDSDSDEPESTGVPAARRWAVTPGHPIPVEVASRGGRRLFVNIGAARGKPSHWVLYDDTTSELTFHEVGPD